MHFPQILNKLFEKTNDFLLCVAILHMYLYIDSVIIFYIMKEMKYFTNMHIFSTRRYII